MPTLSSPLPASPSLEAEGTSLIALSEDSHRSIFEYLRVHDQLRFGSTCREMARRCEEALSAPTLFLEGAEDVTDAYASAKFERPSKSLHFASLLTSRLRTIVRAASSSGSSAASRRVL